MTNQLMVIEPEQFETTQRIAQAMVASGYFNDAKDVAQAIVKIMAGQELGLPPFAAMTSIHVIKGKPVLGANALATLVKNHPHYDYRVKSLDGKGCTIAFYENGDHLGDSSFTASDAKAAGLTGGNWQKYSRNMYFARAMSNGAKWFTPGIFGGAPVYTPDELGADVDGEGEIIDVVVDTRRELGSLAVIVDHEPEQDEDVGESEPPPKTVKKTNGNGKQDGPRVTASMLRELHALGTSIHKKEWNTERAKISKGFGKETSKDWRIEEYYSILEPMKDEKANAELFEDKK